MRPAARPALRPELLAGLLAGIALALAGAAGAAPPLPGLRMFADGFQAGTWEAGGVGRHRERRAFADPADLVFAGKPINGGCRVTVVEDSPARAVLTWSCPGGDSGRSHVRRDHSGLYVVQAQGISGRLPFAYQAEYRFVAP